MTFHKIGRNKNKKKYAENKGNFCQCGHTARVKGFCLNCYQREHY